MDILNNLFGKKNKASEREILPVIPIENLRSGSIKTARHHRSISLGDNFQSHKDRGESGPSFVCDVLPQISSVQLVFSDYKFGQSF